MVIEQKYDSIKKLNNGFSLLTVCMNREENLLASLKSWIQIPELNEIVIVNWSSDENYYEKINEFKKYKTIKFVNVLNESYWILSHAYNLGAMFIEYDKLLKIDCDVKLNKDFLKCHKLTENNFFTGNWKTAKDENEVHLNGQFLCYTKDYYDNSGFNELLLCYGYDDTELYDRFINNKLQQNFFDLNTLTHQPHSRNSDKNIPIVYNDYIEFLIKHFKFNDNQKLSTQRNRVYLGNLKKNTKTHIAWEATEPYKNYIECTRISEKPVCMNYTELYKSEKITNAKMYLRNLKKWEFSERNCVNNDYFDETEFQKKYNQKINILVGDKSEYIKEPFVFALRPYNGMGNRFRALASSIVLARFFNTELLINWKPTRGFDDTKLQDLIDYDYFSEKYNMKLISNKEYKRIEKNSILLHKKFENVYEANSKSYKKQIKQSEKNKRQENIIDLFHKKWRSIAVRTSENLLNSFEMEIKELIPEAWLMYDKILKDLKPAQSVLNKSQETLNNFGQKTLGVHIRRGDAVGTDFYSRYKEKYGSDVEVYIKRVRELLETEYDKVYISTDCEKSLNAFKQSFGSKCVNFNKKFVSSVWHKQKKGQVDARVEQHLLSCTNYLLTSEWSTFSDFAKHYSDLESEIV